MHQSFYASGFLYSPKLRQILLIKFQQTDSSDFLWSTLGGEGSEGEETKSAFQRIMNKLLGLDLKHKDIYPIYDYFHDTRNKTNYVFYGQIKSTREFNRLKQGNFSCITFHEISKIPFAPHSKQDVIVGERVISAKWREDAAKREEITP